MSIVKAKVKVAREGSAAKTSSGQITEKWWRFGHTARALYDAIPGLSLGVRVLSCRNTSHSYGSPRKWSIRTNLLFGPPRGLRNSACCRAWSTRLGPASLARPWKID